MPRMGRNIVTAGSTVQSITQRIDAILDIFCSLSFHSSHLPPPDFLRLASSSEEDVAVEDRTPIFTLGLLIGERPAAGRFASIMTFAFGAENAREITGRRQETRKRKGMNKVVRLSLFNIPSCWWLVRERKGVVGGRVELVELFVMFDVCACSS